MLTSKQRAYLKSLAMELDPKFCDVIRKRYFRFINKLNYDEDDTGWEDFTPKVEANHDGEKD